MNEEIKKERRPINGERGFGDTDASKHQKIISYGNSVKDSWFRNDQVIKYFDKAKKIRELVDQDWGSSKVTRFGLRHALMRAAHDSYIDTFSDLFDVDDLVTFSGETEEEARFAHDMQLYTNRLLRSRSVDYQRHLNQRFLILPTYGWSPAHDYYRFNEGWATKANAASYMPGLQGLEFGREMDVLNDGPVCETIRPEHCFFGSWAAPWEQTVRGSVKRWTLSDVIAAEKRETKDGKPLYNRDALKKIKAKMLKGEKDADDIVKIGGSSARDVQFNDRERGPYVDVVRMYGPLNEVNDAELAEDGNEYYIEFTRTDLLLWIENPADRHTMFTDMRTHEVHDHPLSRSLLEPVKPHQQFTDLMTNMAMESVVDNLTKHWAVWEDQIDDPNDFYNPKGLNAFLRMTGQQMPVLLGQQRNGAFADVKEILLMLDRDRQRAGAADQELGVTGGTQDKTATGARLLATAATKKTRAIVKRICNDAIIPQIKNIVMLSLVHSKPEARRIFSAGQEINITPAHVAWYLNGANVQVNDTITRDRNEEAMKITGFFQGVGQMVGGLSNPSAAVHIMRYAADINGIPQHIINKALPEPMPPQIPGPVAEGMPPMPGQPPMAQENPMTEGGLPSVEAIP